jgi:hypothetical protein
VFFKDEAFSGRLVLLAVKTRTRLVVALRLRRGLDGRGSEGHRGSFWAAALLEGKREAADRGTDSIVELVGGVPCTVARRKRQAVVLLA